MQRDTLYGQRGTFFERHCHHLVRNAGITNLFASVWSIVSQLDVVWVHLAAFLVPCCLFDTLLYLFGALWCQIHSKCRQEVVLISLRQRHVADAITGNTRTNVSDATLPESPTRSSTTIPPTKACTTLGRYRRHRLQRHRLIPKTNQTASPPPHSDAITNAPTPPAPASSPTPSTTTLVLDLRTSTHQPSN